jgi:hypothetical protein
MHLMDSTNGVPTSELHVTPFHNSHYRMFRLECTMFDKPGVVRELLEAISYLGINVVKMDSCQLNGGRHHFVDLVLDWSGSRQYDDFTLASPRPRWLLRQMRLRVPVDDHRYVKLLEAILVRCWDDLVFDRAHGRPLPSIWIQPFSGRHAAPYDFDATAHRAAGKELHIALKIPRRSATRLRESLDLPRPEPLPYLLSSDSMTRTLRVHFPRPDRLRRMAHVSFFHQDASPGTLASIGRLLREAGFNIVNGLLRKEDHAHSSWEVLIESEKEDLSTEPDLSTRGILSSDERLDVVLDRLRQAPKGHKPDSALALAELRVAASETELRKPSYPTLPPYEETVFPDTVADPRQLERAIEREANAWDARFQRFQADTKYPTSESHGKKSGTTESRQRQGDIHEVARGHIRDLTVSAISHRQPVLFLSYPESATHLANLFKQDATIKSIFYVDEYQAKDGSWILKTAAERIQSCDMFVGIWHPNEDDKRSLSPWMHCEFGIAYSRQLAHRVACCKSIDKALTLRRFEPHLAHDSYPQEGFDGAFLRKFVKGCVDEWDQWNRRRVELFHSRD